jgi:UDP-N-acetylmuramoyl-L-alanyl-D-glutamate--2,6-diaminopimelate ligase
MRVGDLIQGLPILSVGPQDSSEVRICDLTEDSRTVLPGSLFIARRGEQADGRRHIPDAVRAGAVAVLTDAEGAAALATSPPSPGGVHAKSGRQPEPVALLTADNVELAAAQLAERFYGSPSADLTLVGVTGTNGKTTVTWLVHQLLNRCGRRCGLVGTVYVDDGGELAPATLTTPPALELSRTLGLMRDAGCHAAAIEVSSHALEQHRVGALAFDAAIFTNLTGDHLDYHETMAAYAAAKARLFAMLPPDGLAVVNADDPAAATMLKATRARPVRCSIAAAQDPGVADASAAIDEMSIQGTTATYQGPWGQFRARTRLVGAHNVMNVLQAIVVAHGAAGLEPALIEATLGDLTPPPGRLEPVTRRNAPLSVFVDYAHSDDSLETVLRTLRDLLPQIRARASARGGRLCVVFGCGGDRDRTKRPRMGRIAARHADRVIITSDNPRREDPGAIIGEIRAGVPTAAEAEIIIERVRAVAIRRAIASAAPGDVVLIAGKGHEDYQIVSDGMGGTIRRHLDDRQEARAALALRGIDPLPAPNTAGKPCAEEAGEPEEIDTFDADWIDSHNGAETEQV